ncbi:hypothetical protein [Streptomyces lydicus]|uniref:hypothetical protein n=1 Tax=Streptomyces lydicus TaxID=47763 RepID=UPI00378EC523
METHEIAESAAVSAWLSAATVHPAASADLWQENPHIPRRLLCGVTFDIVLADRQLIETAYQLLAQYEQPLGPALTFVNLRSAAVLVPPGTTVRWNGLVAASQWSERLPRPACLGTGHAILVPALAPQPTAGHVHWLISPDNEQGIGGAPLLTSPVPLARCLAEARALHTAALRSPLSRVVSVVKAVLPSSERA